MPAYTINSITSVFQMITLVKEEAFATIQHEQGQGHLGDADFQSLAYDLLREEADNFASNCGSICAKKFVEEYGTFQALKKAEEHGYSLKGIEHEGVFYKYLLTIILFLSDEAYDSTTSSTDYDAYCEANPLEA
jgi:hypothetical protein